ncbi:MAG: hypothetical protein M3Q69_03850 [Acidobacteriota bacterium]|nr:hypothetical protein [Acidobacteriota bacterium]
MPASFYAVQPTAFVLTYESATRIAGAANNGLPRGVFPVEFRDADDLQGFYTLYLQIEVLP